MSIADKFNILLMASILPWASSVDKDNTLYSLGAFFFFFGSFISSPPGGRISFLKPFLTDLVFCFLSLHVCVHVCVCVRMYLAMLFFILHFISRITICIIHVLVIY